MEGAGFGLVLPVMVQSLCGPIAVEVTVKSLPVACPGYTAVCGEN